MPEKAVYSLTDAGHEEFEKLMFEISCKPINLFLDFNAVIVNLESMSKEQQRECLDHMRTAGYIVFITALTDILLRFPTVLR